MHISTPSVHGSRLLKWEPLNSCIMLLSLYSWKKEWALLLCPSLWRKIKQTCQQSWLQGSYLADNFASRNIWKDCSIPEHNSGTKVTTLLWMIFVLEHSSKNLRYKICAYSIDFIWSTFSARMQIAAYWVDTPYNIEALLWYSHFNIVIKIDSPK